MIRRMLLAIFVSLVSFGALAEEPRPSGLLPVPIQNVTVEDEFWSPRRRVWQEVTIRDAFKKFENDRGGALNNFDKVRDGMKGGHAGPPWYDGLIYEMIRGASDFLLAHPDPELETRLDGYITRIAAAAARDPDGYVNTWTQLEEPDHRWGLNGGYLRWQHDVYNAGALVEAGVHYYRATGKTKLLEVAVKFANHMCDVMGPPPKKNIVPAHSLPEEAMVELYKLFRENPNLKKQISHPVNEPRYMGLAEFWIENRGNHAGRPDWEKEGSAKAVEYIRNKGYGDGRPSWGAYAQDHKPVLEQETIEGHAVRATLMCTGLAAAARLNARKDYYQAAKRLWNNMVLRRMHITGGVGAFADEERFGPDYVLPNNAYLETCAAVGAAFFHRNMSLVWADAKYVDELERVLYNGALSGVSLKGDAYFYRNPLEAGTDRDRWSWHECPCCPPMFLKLMGAMPGYIYAQDEEGIYINLFVGSRASIGLGENEVTLSQATKYPWDGTVKIAVDLRDSAEFSLRVRIPGWSEGATLKLNGNPVNSPEMVQGYAHLHRMWKPGDIIELTMPMPVRRIRAHPRIEADLDRIALMRGPIVYCLESSDNDGHVWNLSIPREARLSAEYNPDLLGGVTVIKGEALAVQTLQLENPLYMPLDRELPASRTQFTAIPYFANTNRGPAEIRVWIPEALEPLAAASLP